MRSAAPPHLTGDVQASLAGSLDALAAVPALAGDIAAAAAILWETAAGGGTLVLFGNGGSAAHAQHLVADLVGRFVAERPPLRAIALSADPSVLTALGNDYGFEAVFARQVEALVGPGDAVVALSTSGRSANVLRGAEAARRRGAKVIALTGRDGGALAALADVAVRVPSDHVGRVQEAHIVIGHAWCAALERLTEPAR